MLKLVIGTWYLVLSLSPITDFMKKVALFSFLFSLLLVRVSGHGQTLTVVVHGVKSDQGLLRIGLYNSDKEFMKTRWESKGSKAKVGDVQIVFEGVPPGFYAISLFHDANENGKLDSNFAGIPREGFGFSNNVIGTFGPPSFEEAEFAFEGEKKIEITLKYR